MRRGTGGTSEGPTSARARERPGTRPPPALLTAATLWLAAACGSGQDIERPVPLVGSGAVRYPLEMWNRNIEGTTLLRVLVNVEGGIDSVMVVESSGHPALDSAAVGGARTMRFRPAERRGRPLGIWVRLPVDFRKNPSAPQPDSGSAPDAEGAPAR